jgi:isopentenyl-diphosphate Delta-isomerase
MPTKEHSIVARVDDGDNVVDTVERGDVFRLKANFRVVHIFLFNRDGQLLIQQIARDGTRSPGLWGSSVAGYVLATETYENAAHRKILQEIGVDLSLSYIGKTAMDDDGCKKFIGLYAGICDGPFLRDKKEIDAVRFIDVESVDTTSQEMNAFTPTFLHALRFYKSIPQQMPAFPLQENAGRRDELLDLYKIAVDEYRFEVKLNWDRTAFCLTISSVLLTIATGVLRSGNGVEIYAPSLGFFLVGALMTAVGPQVMKTGKKYYRTTILKKTLIEKELGYHDNYIAGVEHKETHFAIGTTLGMRDVDRILKDPDSYLAQPSYNIFGPKVLDGVARLFMLLMVLHVSGCVFCVASILTEIRAQNHQSRPSKDVSAHVTSSSGQSSLRRPARASPPAPRVSG